MTHIRRISMSKAMLKEDDPDQVLFFQIFFAAISFIFSLALGK